ncbi:MAG: transcription antitermination factor NusB [Micavibrio sp.]|nr:MAG: transcription antitermination factor NusB [Micavibrio sp.]
MKRDVKLTEGSKKARRSAARLAAVQVLYQAWHQEQPIKNALAEYNAHRLGFQMDGDLYVPADGDLLADITGGYDTRREDIDAMVAGALDGRSPEQIDKLLLHILCAGAYEILAHHDIDTGIIIADYLNVTEAFFDKNEKKLVNAVLDRLAKTLRD